MVGCESATCPHNRGCKFRVEAPHLPPGRGPRSVSNRRSMCGLSFGKLLTAITIAYGITPLRVFPRRAEVQRHQSLCQGRQNGFGCSGRSMALSPAVPCKEARPARIRGSDAIWAISGLSNTATPFWMLSWSFPSRILFQVCFGLSGLCVPVSPGVSYVG